MVEFNLEEIYLIKSCNTNDIDRAIKILEGYNRVQFEIEMQTVIRNTLTKLREIKNPKMFIALRNYPV